MANKKISSRCNDESKTAVGITGFAVSGVPVGATDCHLLVIAGRRKYICLVNEQGAQIQSRHYKMTRGGLVSVKLMEGDVISHTGRSITVRTGIHPGDTVRIFPAKR